jgi:hypothetical protein
MGDGHISPVDYMEEDTPAGSLLDTQTGDFRGRAETFSFGGRQSGLREIRPFSFTSDQSRRTRVDPRTDRERNMGTQERGTTNLFVYKEGMGRPETRDRRNLKGDMEGAKHSARQKVMEQQQTIMSQLEGEASINYTKRAMELLETTRGGPQDTTSRKLRSNMGAVDPGKIAGVNQFTHRDKMKRDFEHERKMNVMLAKSKALEAKLKDTHDKIPEEKGRRKGTPVGPEPPTVYWAIVKGWVPSMLTTSEDDARRNTMGYPDPDCQAFDSREEAQEYIDSGGRAQEEEAELAAKQQCFYVVIGVQQHGVYDTLQEAIDIKKANPAAEISMHTDFGDASEHLHRYIEQLRTTSSQGPSSGTRSEGRSDLTDSEGRHLKGHHTGGGHDVVRNAIAMSREVGSAQRRSHMSDSRVRQNNKWKKGYMDGGPGLQYADNYIFLPGYDVDMMKEANLDHIIRPLQPDDQTNVLADVCADHLLMMTDLYEAGVSTDPQEAVARLVTDVEGVLVGLPDREVELRGYLESLRGQCMHSEDSRTFMQNERGNITQLRLWLVQITNILAEKAQRSGQVDILSQVEQHLYSQGPPTREYQQTRHLQLARDDRVKRDRYQEASNLGRGYMSRGPTLPRHSEGAGGYDERDIGERGLGSLSQGRKRSGSVREGGSEHSGGYRSEGDGSISDGSTNSRTSRGSRDSTHSSQQGLPIGSD